MKTKHYRVAGLSFSLSIKADDPLWQQVASYTPFETEKPDEPFLFHLCIEEQLSFEKSSAVLRADMADDVAKITAYESGETQYICMAPPYAEESVILAITPQTSAKATLYGNASLRLFGLNNALMLLYAVKSAAHQTLMMHSSVLLYRGKGYLFLGKSGTGKSTHTRLWLNHIPNCSLLNDDNPIVRIVEKVPTVFGSPWSGKTPCYKNEQAPIGAITRLEQAPENSIIRLNPIRSYAAILPSASCIKWDQKLTRFVHDTLAEIAEAIPCFQLRCLPNADAALLSSQTLAND